MKKVGFLLILLLMVVIGYTQSNGTYCADVDRYNPKTGKESSYRLTVGVDNKQVVRLDWPNGGCSGSDEFNPVPIKNNKAVFKAFDGVSYKVSLLEKGSDCFGDVPESRQCIAKTKSGRRCKNRTDNLSQKCHIHNK